MTIKNPDQTLPNEEGLELLPRINRVIRLDRLVGKAPLKDFGGVIGEIWTDYRDVVVTASVSKDDETDGNDEESRISIKINDHLWTRVLQNPWHEGYDRSFRIVLEKFQKELRDEVPKEQLEKHLDDLILEMATYIATKKALERYEIEEPLKRLVAYENIDEIPDELWQQAISIINILYKQIRPILGFGPSGKIQEERVMHTNIGGLIIPKKDEELSRQEIIEFAKLIVAIVSSFV